MRALDSRRLLQSFPQKNDLFRIGASGLLTDIERQLHHSNTGEYAAAYYMPMC